MEGVFFYKHYFTMRHDARVKELDYRLGERRGYCHWALLLEQYASSCKRTLDLNANFMQRVIAEEHGWTVEQLFDFIDACADVGLVEARLWHESRQVYNDTAWQNTSKLIKNADTSNKSKAGKASAEARRRKAEQAEREAGQ